MNSHCESMAVHGFRFRYIYKYLRLLLYEIILIYFFRNSRYINVAVFVNFKNNNLSIFRAETTTIEHVIYYLVMKIISLSAIPFNSCVWLQPSLRSGIKLHTRLQSLCFVPCNAIYYFITWHRGKWSSQRCCSNEKVKFQVQEKKRF